MKAKDLSIGNWVQYDSIPYQIESLTKVDAVVHSIDIFDFRNRSLENAQPIELTEDILANLFGKPRTNGNKFDIYNIPTSGIEIQDRRKSALPTPTICIVKFGVHICYIKYLHQLQNVYHLLTGEELEVKL